MFRCSAIFSIFGVLLASIQVYPYLAKASETSEIVAHPIIIDGDTIRIDDKRIRLYGIDAPEAKQTCKKRDGSVFLCGDMATFALASLIGEHLVSCRQTDKDRYGRIIAVCSAGTVILNVEMVRSGWAMAYRRYSTEYVEHELEAKAAQRGMWQGRFVNPREWRKGIRLLSEGPVN